MILIDFTQTIIAGLMAQLKINNGEVSEDMLRHMILNSVRMYQKKYGPEYGQITLCTDASHTWRKDFMPLYKANRKKSRDASNLDWGVITSDAEGESPTHDDTADTPSVMLLTGRSR